MDSNGSVFVLQLVLCYDANFCEFVWWNELDTVIMKTRSKLYAIMILYSIMPGRM